MKVFKVGFKSSACYSVNMIWANTGKEEREAVEETAARRAARYGYVVSFVEEITEREAQSNIDKGMPYYGIDEQAERDHDPSFAGDGNDSENDKELFINNQSMGKVIGYRQNRELHRWVFLMKAGYYIGVDFSNIKHFTSCGNLEIITYLP